MKTLLLIGWVGAFLVAALAYPVALILCGGAVEAYIISAKDPSLIATEKAIFDPPKADKNSKEYRNAVMSIYGLPVDEPTPVLFVPKEKFIHPEELPSLTLLPVDKQKGENPLQAKTVRFFAARAVVGASVAGVVLLLGWLILRSRSRKAAPPAAA